MLEQFESPRELLSRARDNAKDLDARIRSFFARKPRPYTEVIEYDSETGQDVYKVRLTAKLPGSMAAVLKDATGNLRDALDHATYASAISLRSPSLDKTGFPFAKTAAGVESELSGPRLKGIPTEIRPLLAGFQPYETGNQLLWALNRIRNTKTHRILVPLGAVSLGTDITGFGGRVLPPSEIGYCRWDPATYEVEYMRLGRGSEFHHNINVAFEVTLGDVEVIGGQPAIPALNALASEVERIILAIEAETERLLR